jgi:hypothetical protein
MLPRTTQDSVQDCWLSFVLIAIPDDTCFLSFQGAILIKPYVRFSRIRLSFVVSIFRGEFSSSVAGLHISLLN